MNRLLTKRNLRVIAVVVMVLVLAGCLAVLSVRGNLKEVIDGKRQDDKQENIELKEGQQPAR